MPRPQQFAHYSHTIRGIASAISRRTLTALVEATAHHMEIIGDNHGAQRWPANAALETTSCPARRPTAECCRSSTAAHILSNRRGLARCR
jgi:hypothetical protein